MDVNRPSELYQEEFDILCDTAYRLSQGARIPHPQYYAKMLQRIAEEVPRRNSFSIARQDIEQQLELIWFEAVLSYSEIKSKTTLRSYLIRCGVFGLRDWLWDHFKSLDKEPSSGVCEESLEASRELSLVWLLCGTKEQPWCRLTSYERYLIFLRYARGLTINEVAKLSRTGRDKVMNRLKRVKQKLRRVFNEATESGRCC